MKDEPRSTAPIPGETGRSSDAGLPLDHHSKSINIHLGTNLGAIMYLRILAAAGIAVTLSSCATTESMSRMNTYKFPVHHVKMADDIYRVYEHKSDNSLMVAPSLGTTMAIGAAQGATLGLADAMTPEKRLEAAAQQHLVDTGRGGCKITRGHLLQKPLYEFWFECPAVEPKASSQYISRTNSPTST